MIARTTFAATLAVCAIAAPAASAAPAPDLSKMALAPTDLPSGTSVFVENSFPLGSGAREYDGTSSCGAVPASRGSTTR